jgi:hypothetical protein
MQLMGNRQPHVVRNRDLYRILFGKEGLDEVRQGVTALRGLSVAEPQVNIRIELGPQFRDRRLEQSLLPEPFRQPSPGYRRGQAEPGIGHQPAEGGIGERSRPDNDLELVGNPVPDRAIARCLPGAHFT